MTPKVITGARAVFSVYDPATGKIRPMGTVSSVSFAIHYGVQPADTLGRYSPDALEYVNVEPVTLNCQGWRSFGHGAHADLAVPKVQELLTHNSIELTVYDRYEQAIGNADPRFYTIKSIRPAGYSVNIGTKALVEQGTTYIGLLCEDESGVNTEHPSATSLP